MSKIDYKKQYQALYSATANPQLVEVPALSYLMIDGEGDPNTAKAYSDAIATLYGLSYTLKFMIKKGPEGHDYGVMPLEGLWWADNMEEFSVTRKDIWKWTSMIMQPELVTEEHIRQAIRQVPVKKPLPSLQLVRCEQLHEGLAVQVLHKGPYSEETATMEVLHGYMRQQGLKFTGRHHEIYLNDVNRTAPDRLRTIIRQPVSR
ncbi:MAG: Protein of unknown function DUF2174-like protein [Paenibacillaceae bacterium]|jgi:hypothetical protein|nr:Protein of unknown function DUF2174-like protein [Paenibacillaceae bacterium]